ncbi:hypothetical protein V8D89_009186 [Ganoderma adspersum]
MAITSLCLLALHPIDVQNVEEAVLWVQGFIIEASLPPVRQVDIPRTLNRLIDLKQSVTLTGLGTDGFDLAVHSVQTIHQVLSNHISRAGGHLRNWTPGRDGQDLTLMFGNHYLTSSRDVGGDISIDMLPIVHPLNVLCLLIKTEVHTADNVVEYWELCLSKVYMEIKPGLFALTNLVEVQVSFAIIHVAHQEYAFIPKLRAICLLDRIVEMDCNLSAIHVLASGQLLPLKKIKCKVGYRMSSLDESGNDDGQLAPNKHLRRLTLSEAEGEVERTDVSMKEIA